MSNIQDEAERRQPHPLRPHPRAGLMLQGNFLVLSCQKKEEAKIAPLELSGPSPGYRFPAFAPHSQDSEASSDHFANMTTALQWMILQPADNAAGSSLPFAAPGPASRESASGASISSSLRRWR